ncbi:MAG: radical SAM protein [Methanothrix sp.]|nr:MAG: radical SAM protein [Methanothrix sp.]
MILKPFDPWKNQLCTCPSKLSLNPYTGCTHGCLYCYATSYIPRFLECRPKADLLRNLAREAARVKPGILVALSNSSDPYPAMERDLNLSRGCLQILWERNLAVQMVTKSNLVVKDADLLSGMRATVAVTVTTLDRTIAEKLENGAPSPKRRLEAIRILAEHEIPVSARIDPIIPGINDQDIGEVVHAVCEAGAKHITSSTYKARSDSLKRICTVFPDVEVRLKVLYRKEGRIAGSLYLPVEMRRNLMSEVEQMALAENVTFSSCREGFAAKGGVKCDGSHLVPV